MTGANRGIGRAIVDEALHRGAQRVYAAMRRPVPHPDARVIPLPLDVTDTAQVQALADRVVELDMLVNNAGVSVLDDLGERSVLEQHLAVNLFGPYAVTQTLLPHLLLSRGTVVNVLSLASLASVPVMPAYSISKAAAYSLTQSQRGLLAPQGVRVHAVLAGPVDTDMVRDLPVLKADPASVARAIFDGVAAGAEDIFPDPLSASIEPGWATGPIRTLEQANAALLRAAA
ncbi:SDR family oxidoreductase [Luedemannella flava]|uniref:SDR family oxidoreductase n=1 Tax=Luedemannella flava TaxID=349316 RepID=A0ABP4YQT5_9ACTN